MDSDTLRRLSALKLAPEAMAEVLLIFADIAGRNETRLASQRERKQRSRDRHATVTVQVCDEDDNPSPKEIPPTPPKEITPTQSLRSFDLSAREFPIFWQKFENKTGKPKALAAFIAARKRASFEEIMEGLARYIRDKPPDRQWLNPTTFLNQDRWEDQPAPIGKTDERHRENPADKLARVGREIIAKGIATGRPGFAVPAGYGADRGAEPGASPGGGKPPIVIEAIPNGLSRRYGPAGQAPPGLPDEGRGGGQHGGADGGPPDGHGEPAGVDRGRGLPKMAAGFQRAC